VKGRLGCSEHQLLFLLLLLLLLLQAAKLPEPK
jgi:hypothetical protein